MATRGGHNVGSSTVVEGGWSRVMCYFWSARSTEARLLGWPGLACGLRASGRSGERHRGPSSPSPSRGQASSGRQLYHSAAVACPPYQPTSDNTHQLGPKRRIPMIPELHARCHRR